jgi:hypothetical protein
MGLFVLPIYSEAEPTRIDYMQVSTSPPSYISQVVTEPATSGPITPPVPHTKIGQNVGAAKTQGDRHYPSTTPVIYQLF